MYCDYNIENYVRKNNYEYLNNLTPAKRFAEKFRLEIEALDIEINADDEFAGWFKFQKNCSDYVMFDDEVFDEQTKTIVEAPSLFGTVTKVDKAHTLLCYEEILDKGIISYEERIDSELIKHPNNEYLEAMKSTVDSVKAFMKRIELAVEKILHDIDAKERGNLREIREMIKRVPYYPASNFREAVQSAWIIHFLTPLAENAWYSISLGKFDDYMYKYYKKSLDEGMTKSEAKKILRNFYELLNAYADGACLLNVGPVYNELSELLIECQKDFALPAPILGARVDDNTPDNIWDLLIDEKMFSMGQPTFYGENACINALLEKGLSRQEAEKFANNSCMSIGIPGNEFNSMWGCVFSVSAALEVALSGGKLLNNNALIVPNIKKPENSEEVFNNFEICVEFLMNICARSYEKRAEYSEKTDPDCFLSMLTPGCIENHCDRISGVKYHNVTVECMGMVNAADGIYALNKLVFDDKKYTLDEVNDAVKNNFENCENMHADIMNCKKFGENSDADICTVRVAEIMQKAIRSLSHDNMYYLPSLHTLDSNVSFGSVWGAGYDGRFAGMPFAKNAGPSNNVRNSEPTSMILSSSALPQTKFYGGQPIDVNFQTDMVKNHKNEIKALVMIYHNRNGLQFQVNSVSSKLLRDATDNPEKYPNLVVRVGGYSLYFNTLSRASKEEFIERFEKEGF